MRVLLLNKPFRVLPQFTDTTGRATLRDYVPIRGVYPAGRLDYDSEGLMVLTDHGAWQARVADPRSGFTKTYFAQVEGVVTERALETLRLGVELRDGPSRPVDARIVAEPDGLWPRHPPIRHRRNVPTAWLELVLTEGRNRQVRRMTAAVGLPTLRLVRWAIGPWSVAGLEPGNWREVPGEEARRVLGSAGFRRNAPGSRPASRARAPARSSASGRPANDRRVRDRRR